MHLKLTKSYPTNCPRPIRHREGAYLPYLFRTFFYLRNMNGRIPDAYLHVTFGATRHKHLYACISLLVLRFGACCSVR